MIVFFYYKYLQSTTCPLAQVDRHLRRSDYHFDLHVLNLCPDYLNH